MYIIEKLKHNRMRQVDVPSAHDLYKQYGLSRSAGSMYSGDENIKIGLDKIAQANNVMTQVNTEPEPKSE